SSRRRHTRCYRDWSSDVCSSDLHPRRERVRPGAARVPLFQGGEPEGAVKQGVERLENARRYEADRGVWQSIRHVGPGACEKRDEIGRASCREGEEGGGWDEKRQQ